MDELLIATGNPHKFEEMQDALASVECRAVSLSDVDVELTEPESGDTYRENALIKAREAHRKSGLRSLADDSGLEVDALGGKPGVRSARWGGEDTPADEKNRLMLEELEGCPPEDRRARYVCEMVLVDETGLRHASRGECHGKITREPRGTQGFGYDPIFEVKDADGKTFGELPEAVKQKLSHRARALRRMIETLRRSH